MHVPPKGFNAITVHEETLRKVAELADTLGCSVSEITTDAINYYTNSDEFKEKILGVIEKRKEELQQQQEAIQRLEAFAKKR